MEETTLYNHDTLGTAEKPLILNRIFKKVVDALKAGDVAYYDFVQAEYTFESRQQVMIAGLLQQICK